ncbi:hypothetical protein J4573_51145 [Actinomadura barringtoniae]|uniref:Uncharacterized protein n=1 Tax=Actinomadura barringtoniae TaxID=1427535 RepID=A0A939T9V4_9ACTN|nr:hypothetical protein [Actinomadura barringtoniae]MBO2455513.1 hypothetical protein [Actinomadura barringtoniae]
MNEFDQPACPACTRRATWRGGASVPVPMAAVIAAAASGTVAAAVIDQDLLSADFDLPNPLARARS